MQFTSGAPQPASTSPRNPPSSGCRLPGGRIETSSRCQLRTCILTISRSPANVLLLLISPVASSSKLRLFNPPTLDCVEAVCQRATTTLFACVVCSTPTCAIFPFARPIIAVQSGPLTKVLRIDATQTRAYIIAAKETEKEVAPTPAHLATYLFSRFVAARSGILLEEPTQRRHVLLTEVSLLYQQL